MIPDLTWRVRVHPNPFTEKLTVESKGIRPEQVITLRLFSVEGKLIQETAYSAKEKFIWNMHAIAQGSYILSVEHDGEKRQFLLIKE